MDEEKYIIEEREGVSEPKNDFPVKAQLLILSLIIVGLFGGLIIPNTMMLLKKDKNNTIVTEVVSATQEAQVSSEIKNIDPPAISGQSAFVWDVAEQRVLFQKEADTILPLASITKLMTALLAYELVENDTPVTVSRRAAMQQSGGDLSEGEQFAIKDLADFALISSYNSAAYTLADSVGALLGDKDPVVQFVDGMNIRAKELQLHSLKFLNPTGLDISESQAGAFGSARDVTFLMQYIHQNHPQILESTIISDKRFYNLSGQYHDARNTNQIVYDIPNIKGSKTGFTDLAGGNLTVIFDAGFNRPVIVTVLGSTRSERFSDVQKMIEVAKNMIVIKDE